LADWGLTGIIAWAEIQLRAHLGSRIDAETIPYHSLAEFQKLSNESDEALSIRSPGSIASREPIREESFSAETNDKKPNLEVRNKTGQRCLSFCRDGC